MAYRSGLIIKKEIIKCLKKEECVISQLERKVNTSDKVLKRHLAELEFLGIVKIIKHNKSSKTGRPYTTAKLII
ncbi:MAG: ArsR family transcriptional regulator [Candidatus Gracilibacteria bacterium]|jgi:DNA-binding HxlR family transcriptional regulator